MSVRPEGKRWDFTLAKYRGEAMQLINKLKPYRVVGSPPCRVWSSLQNLNRCRPAGEALVAKAQGRAKAHLQFRVRVYRAQMRAGRYLIHRHPHAPSSWKVEEIDKLSESPTVMKAYANSPSA